MHCKLSTQTPDGETLRAPIAHSAEAPTAIAAFTVNTNSSTTAESKPQTPTQTAVAAARAVFALPAYIGCHLCARQDSIATTPASKQQAVHNPQHSPEQ
jgi:hypothetical protein